MDGPGPRIGGSRKTPFQAASQWRVAGDVDEQGGHYPPGAGDVPEEDWGLLIRFLKDSGLHCPVVFEVRPPPRSPRWTALETLLQSRRYVERLIDKYT